MAPNMISLNCGTLDKGNLLYFRGENKYIFLDDSSPQKWIKWIRNGKMFASGQNGENIQLFSRNRGISATQNITPDISSDLLNMLTVHRFFDTN